MGSARARVAIATAAVTALTTVGLVAGTTPATASAAKNTAIVGMECGANVFGVLPNSRFIRRELSGVDVVRQTRSSPLPYRPRSIGFFGYRDIHGGIKRTFQAIVRDGRPRLLTITEHDSSRRTTFGSRRMLNRRFEPRLFTNSGGAHVFAVDRDDRLWRYVIHGTDRGRFFFDGARRVPISTHGIRTLTFYARTNVGGVRTDILLATTRSGALRRIDVPVRRPGQADTTRISGRGFGRYTGLSVGYCDDDESTGFIVAIDARRNLAHRFILTNARDASSDRLSQRRRVARDFNWRLRATL